MTFKENEVAQDTGEAEIAPIRPEPTSESEDTVDPPIENDPPEMPRLPQQASQLCFQRGESAPRTCEADVIKRATMRSTAGAA